MKTMLAALALALACAAMARPSHQATSGAETRAHQMRSDGGYDDEEDRA